MNALAPAEREQAILRFLASHPNIDPDLAEFAWSDRQDFIPRVPHADDGGEPGRAAGLRNLPGPHQAHHGGGG